MSRMKSNIIANFIGRVWSVLSVWLFIPLYVKLLGVESYALIGIFNTLYGIIVIADLGLSSTLNREIARLSVQEGSERQAVNLSRTLEIVLGGLMLLVILLMELLSPVIGRSWVRAEALSPETVVQALQLMGVALGAQFFSNLYVGGLMGLQRQVQFNAVLVGMGLLRGVGAVLLLWHVSATIQTFFAWQIFVSVLQVGLLRAMLWRALPRTDAPPSFERSVLAGVWRYAAGMAGISVTSAILLQVDKLVLSRMLTLEMFGYYTLAATLANVPSLVAGPVNGAVLPRLTQMVSLEDERGLSTLYHRASRWVSVLMIPVGIVFVFFSSEILQLWTGDPAIVRHAHMLVSLLTVGWMLLGLMVIPYALQLAYAWTQLAFWINIVAITILVPLLILLCRMYGALGAGIVWVLLNAGYVLFTIQLMHRRLLKNEQWQWYVHDVGLPLVLALLPALLGRWAMPPSLPLPWKCTAIACIWLVSTLLAGLTLPEVRLRLRKTPRLAGFADKLSD